MTKRMHSLIAAGLAATGILLRVQAQSLAAADTKQLHIMQALPSAHGYTGYPLFLSLCHRLFSQSAGNPVIPVQTIQHIVSGLTAALLFAIVYLLLNRSRIAWLVCAVYWLHPGIIRSSLTIGCETVYSFANALLLLCTVLFFRSTGHPRTIGLLSGVFFGIGCIIQPGAAPYLLLFLGVGGLQCFLTHQRTSPYLLALLGCAIGLGPWWIGHLITAGAA